MERWGLHQPIWFDKVKKRPYEILREDLFVDTVIVGAGLTGILTGLLLNSVGRKVAILTSGEVSSGATAHSTGHLTQVLDTSFKHLANSFGSDDLQKITQASMGAINLIESVVKQYKIDCGFVRTPGFKFAETKELADDLNNELLTAKKIGLDVTELNDNPLPFPVSGLLRFENQAMFDPYRFTLACAEVFVRSGGQIFENTRVLAVEDGRPARVYTPLGSATANHIVLATHTPIGVYLSLHTRVAPYFSYVMAAKLNRQPISGLFWDMDNPYEYMRPLSQNSDVWLIGGRDHKTGQELAPMERYLELQDYIYQHLDVSEITHYWGDELFVPVDGLPYIGKIPFTSSIYTGTGFAGTGLTFGALTGLILTDLLTEKKSPYSELLDPSRVKPVASAQEFIKENINVARWLVADRLSHHELSEVKLIAPNEGRVIDIRGKKIAIYRTENGRIHALSATCTHMGCTVHWNSAEKTWDCPCHGGRFQSSGEILEGPPMKDLEDVRLYTEENPDAVQVPLEPRSAPGFSPMPEQLT